MFWKRKKCEHDWHELQLRTKNEFDVFNGWYKTDYADVYCPICNTHKTYLQSDWILIREAQRIKKNCSKN